MSGRVVSIRATYAFIKADSVKGDFFFSGSDCVEPMRLADFRVGTRVNFEPAVSSDGRGRAKEVRPEGWGK